MKKLLTIFLAICLLLTLVACGNDNIDGNITDYTLEDVAGWWTKPDGYDGITLLYTFLVDAEREVVIGYDDYGNACDEYPCTFDGSGFTIDSGEPFGCVTYVFDNDKLLDGDGNLRYVRCEPLDTDSAPYSKDDLMGVWYKNGDKNNENECLSLDENGYETRQYDIVSGNGTWSIAKVETHYGDLSYIGAAVEFEGESVFSPSDMWVLEHGNILYDDFHGDYFIKEGLDSDTYEKLSNKYGLIRDTWECAEDRSSVRLTFFGGVILTVGSLDETIGTWQMTDGTIRLEYSDGNVREYEAEDEMSIEYSGKAFVRREGWE